MKQAVLRRILEPVIDAAGLELEAIEVVPAGSRSVVRVVVDGDGDNGRGPTLDQLAEVSKAASAALDASSDTGSRPYTLEVSSRGVSRPLTRPAHWRRNAGRLVTVHLTDDRAPVTGRITAATDEGVTLEVSEESHYLDFSDVVRALIEVELNRSTDDETDLSEKE